jgi:hypothetical protein
MRRGGTGGSAVVARDCMGSMGHYGSLGSFPGVSLLRTRNEDAEVEKCLCCREKSVSVVAG